VGALTTELSWLEQGGGVELFKVRLNAISPAKKIGSVFTTGANLTAGALLGAGALHATNFWRTALMVDIIKGSPNYSFKLFFAADGSVQPDMSRATFMTQMEAVTPTSMFYTYSAAQTLAVNEATDGILDSINVFYERTGPEIELVDVALARLT
jgi:hypothetical protein